MRKNKLIELLQAIDGNPEIVLWNGFAGDYQHIDPKFVESLLVKDCKEFVKSMVEYQTKKPLSEERLNEICKKRKWQLPNPFVEEELYKEWYGKNQKRVIIINPKLRGEQTFDRLGTISY